MELVFFFRGIKVVVVIYFWFRLDMNVEFRMKGFAGLFCFEFTRFLESFLNIFN